MSNGSLHLARLPSLEQTELQTLRQHVADRDSKYPRIDKDLDVSKSHSLNLRERIIPRRNPSNLVAKTMRASSNGSVLILSRRRIYSRKPKRIWTSFVLPATTALRASEMKPNISVYHACITTLDIRLDQPKGETDETEVRYREVVAENAALRERLTKVKTDAHRLIQEMRSRLTTSEARSGEFNKKQAGLQALVHALEATKRDSCNRRDHSYAHIFIHALTG